MNRESNNSNYYPQGYLAKIAYHLAQGNISKYKYFLQRQREMYGELTPEDIQVIRRLSIDLQ